VTSRDALRALLVLVVVLVLQLTVVLDIRIAGAHPDLIVGLAVAAGLRWWGFFRGWPSTCSCPPPSG
jgi:hypothetical protein